MAQKSPRKMLAVHRDEPEIDLWGRAECVIRARYDADDAREGEVLGQLAAEQLDESGPLEA